MEHIPAIHAAKVGMRYPGRIFEAGEFGVTIDLDLSALAPGRSPTLRALMKFDRTVASATARTLQVGDSVEVVLVEVERSIAWLVATLPADPAWLSWNNGTVRHLVRRVATTGEYDLLPILADALEDAGCTEHDLLARCRAPGNDDLSWLVTLLATQE
jgi:hypothetical protein